MDSTSITLGISNIAVAGLLVALAIPLVQRRVKMNRIYGVRVKKAFESEDNWYEINAYGGRQVILWSIPLAVFGLVTMFLPLEGNTVLIVLVACAPLIVIVPAVMSWVYANRL